MTAMESGATSEVAVIPAENNAAYKTVGCLGFKKSFS
jgi:hypothetical protein